MKLKEDVLELLDMDAIHQLTTLRDNPSLILKVLDSFIAIAESTSMGKDIHTMTHEKALWLLKISKIVKRWALQNGLIWHNELSETASVCLNYTSPDPLFNISTDQDVAQAFNAAFPLYNEIRKHAMHVSRTSRDPETPAPANGQAAVLSGWVTCTEAAILYKETIDEFSDGIQFNAAMKAISTACSNGDIENHGNRKNRRINPVSLQNWINSQKKRVIGAENVRQ